MIKSETKEICSGTAVVLLLAFCLLLAMADIAKTKDSMSLSSYMESLKEKEEIEDEIIVAVIDTGVNADMLPKNRLYSFSYNCMDGSSNVTDGFGHGTEIVSLIAANTSGHVKIMPIKAADADGNAALSDIREGIEQAVLHGADVINLSLNTYFYSGGNEWKMIIKELADKGIYTVVSAGNQAGSTEALFPANVEAAVVVGAVDEKKEQYYFSNDGDTVDFYAYGKYDGQLGTSFAAAYVTSLIAELEQRGIADVEEKLKSFAEMENGVLWNPAFDTGKEDAEETLYFGDTERTEHDMGAELLNLDWKSMGKEELDQYLGETAPEYVGLFLSELTDVERKALKQKSGIINTDVFVGDMVSADKNGSYNLVSKHEVSFMDYCVQRFQEKKDVFSVSDYRCRSTEAVFYISSPDRNIIYKYVITGLYDKYGVDREDGVGTFQGSDLRIGIFTYKNNGLSYSGTFTRPMPTSIRRYAQDVRAHTVEFYLNDGTYMQTGYNSNLSGKEWDDGMRTYGISVQFNNYKNTRTGYHSDPNAVKMYNAGLGIGTSTTTAMAYQVEEGYNMPQSNAFTFHTLYSGYVKYDCRYGWLSKMGIDFTAAPTTLNDSTGTFSLNIGPFMSLGTRWYTGNALACTSDIPELVFALAADTYTMTSNHYLWNPNTNQWDYWKATTASAVYGTSYTPAYTTPPNGYHAHTREWNGGWTVSGNGTFSVYYYPNSYTMTTNHYQWDPNINQWNFLKATTQSALYGTRYTPSYITSPEGYHKDSREWENGWTVSGDAEFSAYYKPNTYYIVFDGSGGEGYMEQVTATYDKPLTLPGNEYVKGNDFGSSAFLGWSTAADTQGVLYPDAAEVKNLTKEENATVTLYAVWDDCPWIIAEDLYYTLGQAQSGFISREELMSHASAEDREDGIIAPGENAMGENAETNTTAGEEASVEDEPGTELSTAEKDVETVVDENTGKWTSFELIDYQESDFIQFQDSGSVTETYQVKDSAGNAYKKRITVYVVDTTPTVVKAEGTTRFINEKYFKADYENGGLEDNSIWKTDAEYNAVLRETFENLKNDTPEETYRFTHKDILEMKSFVDENGIGNSRSRDALREFYDKFMEPNKIK